MSIYSPTNKDYRVSQKFGVNFQVYRRFGLLAHNGEDIAVPIGTPIYAPIDGIVAIGNQGNNGYGKFVRITEDLMGEKREVTLAHLSKILVKTHEIVKAKQLIGYSGNTGFSTGPHLHWQLRRLNPDFTVQNYNNGFKGSVDIFNKGWVKNHNETISKY